MFRKILFWTHLSCGVAAGLVVLMMSVTGVLLTYERQAIAWAEHEHFAAPAAVAERRPVAELIAAVRAHEPGFVPTTVTVRADPRAPVVFGAGRSGSLYVNPYTAEVAEPGAEGLRAFFESVEGWHRWFNASGENRAAARSVTGAANLVFLFLILSGLYLWLPRVWRWPMFKARLLLSSHPATSKARDFNWHHVFGIWSALPLAVVVATAVVFSYPWANALVYRSVGEEPPVRGGPPRGPAPAANAVERSVVGEALAARTTDGSAATYDELLALAIEHAGDWRTLTLNLPERPDAASVRIAIDQGNGGQPQRRHTRPFAYRA